MHPIKPGGPGQRRKQTMTTVRSFYYYSFTVLPQ